MQRREPPAAPGAGRARQASFRRPFAYKNAAEHPGRVHSTPHMHRIYIPTTRHKRSELRIAARALSPALQTVSRRAQRVRRLTGRCRSGACYLCSSSLARPSAPPCFTAGGAGAESHRPLQRRRISPEASKPRSRIACGAQRQRARRRGRCQPGHMPKNLVQTTLAHICAHAWGCKQNALPPPHTETGRGPRWHRTLEKVRLSAAADLLPPAAVRSSQSRCGTTSVSGAGSSSCVWPPAGSAIHPS